jgi:hypothetical protein
MKALSVMNAEHRYQKIPLRRTMDLKLRRSPKKDIFSKIFSVSRRTNPRKKSQRDKNINQSPFKLQKLKKRRGFSTTFLGLQTQIKQSLNRQDSPPPESHSHSKTNTIKKLGKLQIRQSTICSKIKNSRRKARRLSSQAPAQQFSTSLA